jgi:hypothetical protein
MTFCFTHTTQQVQVQQIDHRALNYFIEDLVSVCSEDDKTLASIAF